jgi:DeoR/GlpR family transcriptional regulator of sugar metabolism
MDLNPEEVRIKRELAEVCERVIGVFDHTKWHKKALLSFVPTQRIGAIVTDAGAPADLVQEWRDHQIEVVTAELNGTPGTPQRSSLRALPASDLEEVADTSA